MSMGHKALERVMGVPLAAPETADMKAQRRTWTASMFAAALLLVLTSFGPASWARALAPADLVVMVVAAVVGYRFLTRKRAIDDAWFDQQVAKGGDA